MSKGYNWLREHNRIKGECKYKVMVHFGITKGEDPFECIDNALSDAVGNEIEEYAIDKVITKKEAGK